jgi:hypothetical protein
MSKNTSDFHCGKEIMITLVFFVRFQAARTAKHIDTALEQVKILV